MQIHCIGIKGIGLSALAQILVAEGHTVTGSDVSEHFPADEALRAAGIEVKEFSDENITDDIDLVIVSNAYLVPSANPKPETLNSKQIQNPKPKTHNRDLNPEIAQAERLGISVQSYPEALGEIFNKHQGLAVAGSHGKSTTSALLAVTLEALERDPLAVIGAVVKNWNSNARVPTNDGGSDSPSFVIEADEYRNAFLNYKPFGAVVTGIDWDHPDFFETETAYREAFTTFMEQVREGGFLVVNGDDNEIIKALKPLQDRTIIRYGLSVTNTLSITAIEQKSSGVTATLSYKGKPIGKFSTGLFGEHHAMNIAAVVAVCIQLDEKPEAIRAAIKTFQGTRRRFDILTPPRVRSQANEGEPYILNPVIIDDYGQKPVIIDDYAHHPTEIRATIAAARAAFPKRKIRVLFQPHTFSRTAQYFDEFIAALRKADEIALLKTFGSARESDSADGKSAKDLADALSARYFDSHDEALSAYRSDKDGGSNPLSSNDVFIVMGAGDGDKLARELTEQ